MPLHQLLDKKLSKTYEPKTRIDDVFKGYDITFLTNEHGEPVTLFFGRRRPDGIIAGERYTRTIKREPGSLQVKHSHWDNQGKIMNWLGPNDYYNHYNARLSLRRLLCGGLRNNRALWCLRLP